MIKSKISFTASATGPDLWLTVYLDGTQIWHGSPEKESILIEHEFNDSEEYLHVLELEMRGKSRYHTRLDDRGKILEDRCIEISDLCLDDIELGYLLSQKSKYSHDFNGTKELVEEPFWGTMGCNGRVRFEFSSPVYLWLLENL